MTDPISFDPYLGWVDVDDPNSIPEDVRLIGASDLLRYESFGVGATERINSIITDVTDLVTDVAALGEPPAWADITGKPATFTPSAHTHPGSDVAAATTGSSGTMSAADKIKLDNATAVSTYGRLVIRDGNGNAEFGDPLTADDAANKRYTDKFAKGVLGFRTLAGDTGTSTNTSAVAIIDIQPIPVVAGRWYKITWQYGCHTVSGQSPSGIGLELNAANYATVGMAGTQIGGRTQWTSAAGHYLGKSNDFEILWECTATNATQRFVVGVMLADGDNYVASRGELYVEDMGAWEAAVDA
jgi:hypothetical protein